MDIKSFVKEIKTYSPKKSEQEEYYSSFSDYKERKEKFIKYFEKHIVLSIKSIAKELNNYTVCISIEDEDCLYCSGMLQTILNDVFEDTGMRASVVYVGSNYQVKFSW